MSLLCNLSLKGCFFHLSVTGVASLPLQIKTTSPGHIAALVDQGWPTCDRIGISGTGNLRVGRTADQGGGTAANRKGSRKSGSSGRECRKQSGSSDREHSAGG